MSKIKQIRIKKWALMLAALFVFGLFATPAMAAPPTFTMPPLVGPSIAQPTPASEGTDVGSPTAGAQGATGAGSPAARLPGTASPEATGQPEAATERFWINTGGATEYGFDIEFTVSAEAVQRNDLITYAYTTLRDLPLDARTIKLSSNYLHSYTTRLSDLTPIRTAGSERIYAVSVIAEYPNTYYIHAMLHDGINARSEIVNDSVTRNSPVAVRRDDDEDDDDFTSIYAALVDASAHNVSVEGNGFDLDFTVDLDLVDTDAEIVIAYTADGTLLVHENNITRLSGLRSDAYRLSRLDTVSRDGSDRTYTTYLNVREPGTYYVYLMLQYDGGYSRILKRVVSVYGWERAKAPTPSPTPTVTTTPSPTPTVTATPSPTPTATATPTPTPTVTATPSPTPAATATPSPTPTVTAMPSPTPAVTATPSPTPAVTATPSPTPKPTVTVTPTPDPTDSPIYEALTDAAAVPSGSSLIVKFTIDTGKIPGSGAEVLLLTTSASSIQASQMDSHKDVVSISDEGNWHPANETSNTFWVMTEDLNLAAPNTHLHVVIKYNGDLTKVISVPLSDIEIVTPSPSALELAVGIGRASPGRFASDTDGQTPRASDTQPPIMALAPNAEGILASDIKRLYQRAGKFTRIPGSFFL